MAVTGHDRDDYYDEQTAPSTPWHNRTPAVVGASVVGIAVIGILFLAVSYVVRQSGGSEQAPAYFLEPTFSATAPSTSPTTATTTQTITSTVPPVTSDINPSSGPPTSSSDTSGSETSSPQTSAEEDEDDEESRLPTTRRTPRTNITRTLYPRP